MNKLSFLPVSILSGIIAGKASQFLFTRIWRQIDDQDPPQAEHRDVSLGKLATALAIEGALFTSVKGLVDHQARTWYTRSTGEWPGEEHPEPR